MRTPAEEGVAGDENEHAFAEVCIAEAEERDAYLVVVAVVLEVHVAVQ